MLRSASLQKRFRSHRRQRDSMGRQPMPALRMQLRVHSRLPWKLQPKRSWQPPSFQQKMRPQAAPQLRA